VPFSNDDFFEYDQHNELIDIESYQEDLWYFINDQMKEDTSGIEPFLEVNNENICMLYPLKNECKSIQDEWKKFLQNLTKTQLEKQPKDWISTYDDIINQFIHLQHITNVQIMKL